MNPQNIFSICVFVMFAGIVLTRSAIMRKKGIKALVFGVTDKSDFLMVPMILAIAYTVLAKAFGLPMWNPLIKPFWETSVPGWFGLALCIISIFGFVLTLGNFGDSFRVGIDEEKPDKLVTHGIFSVSRNPIYVCFILFFTGLFLIHCNIVILIGGILFALAIHRQVLREEKFLRTHYGDEYEVYCRKVRRYL